MSVMINKSLIRFQRHSWIQECPSHIILKGVLLELNQSLLTSKSQKYHSLFTCSHCGCSCYRYLDPGSHHLEGKNFSQTRNITVTRSSLNHLLFLQAGAVEAGRQELFFSNWHDALLSLLALLLWEVWGSLQQGGRQALVPGPNVLFSRELQFMR